MKGASCPSRDLPLPWALPGQRTAGWVPEPCASICGVCRQVAGVLSERPALVYDLPRSACCTLEASGSRHPPLCRSNSASHGWPAGSPAGHLAALGPPELPSRGLAGPSGRQSWVLQRLVAAMPGSCQVGWTPTHAGSALQQDNTNLAALHMHCRQHGGILLLHAGLQARTSLSHMLLRKQLPTMQRRPVAMHQEGHWLAVPTQTPRRLGIRRASHPLPSKPVQAVSVCLVFSFRTAATGCALCRTRIMQVKAIAAQETPPSSSACHSPSAASWPYGEQPSPSAS